MKYASPSVSFLAGASQFVGGLAVLAWVYCVGIQYLNDPNLFHARPLQIIQSLAVPNILYLIPGILMILMGMRIRAGHLWPAVVLLILSGLSLFKMVALITDLTGPYFRPPLECELPVRILTSFLSVACVYVWQDLSEVSRTRGPRPKRVKPPKPIEPPAASPPSPAPAPPARATAPRMPPITLLTPPPFTTIPRPRMRRDEPPSAQTPWS